FKQVDQEASLNDVPDVFFDDDDDYDEETDDDLLNGGDLLTLAARGRPGLVPHGGSPDSGTLPAAHSLTTQWPDLSAAYAEELDALTVPQLRALAQRRGVSLSGTKREPIVAALSAALGSVPAMRQAWEALSPAARLVAGLVPFVESDY